MGVEIAIEPASKYVHLQYEPFTSKEAFIKRFEQASVSNNDFIEALAFGENEYVLMFGNKTNDAVSSKINAIGRYYKPWFYTHVAKFIKSGFGDEFIPLRDYYHRHTRSLFWELSEIVTFGNQWWFRYLFGYMMPPHIALLKRTQTEELRKLYEEHHVVQDMLVPISQLGPSLAASHQEFNVYPLWLCPMRIFKEDSGFVHPTKSGEEMFVDIGIYGTPAVKTFHHVNSTRAVEDFVRQAEGFQMLYADMYQTREEFKQMFDHKLLESVRAKVGASSAFPEVYDKVFRVISG